MKAIGTIIILSILTSVVNAEEHQIPTAPQEYLDMQNPIQQSEIDEQFLKRVGRLYKRKCSKCHGKKGDGKGYHAESIEIKPAAFSNHGYMISRKDGQLFWIMLNGSEGTEMVPVGPDSDVGLSEEKLWELVTYIRHEFTK
ncbi:c-type cytochrome [Candidatus Halobeggiatoa sp. HSG11]|nr:c-type cytochrome [Candidatus Halobeggiatoa sp. HSG11]